MPLRRVALALSLIAALLTAAPLTASAQSPGNSGLPAGPGNPLADLQRQIDALGQRVADLEAAAQGAVSVSVDCGAGETIADALALPAGLLAITVSGTCNENVTVNRNDVTLVGSATLNGPNASLNTLAITGDRVVVDGLTVTGGRNGVTVAGGGRAVLRNCTVQGVGRTGIVFFQGGNGTVDRCTVQTNGRDGLSVEGAAATIIQSAVSGNTRMGITVTNGGSARIGLDNLNQIPVIPTTVTGNGGSGLFVTVGGHAFVAGTTISGNGTDGASAIRDGAHVFQATLDLTGNNTISGNAAHGVNVIGGRVLIGDNIIGVPVVLNTISGNGALVANSNGVSGFANATLDIRGADISGNTGSGVGLNLQSTARITGASITGNTGNGVGLTNGSGLLLSTLGSFGLPLLAGNGGGFAVGCTAGQPENSVAGAPAAGSQPIGANCSGF